MIYITDLKPKQHVGQWVRYRGGMGEWEEGRIKSWNDRYIFVVFKCDNNWDRFEEYTGQSCYPSTIDFIDAPENPCRQFNRHDQRRAPQSPNEALS